jgi:hypothetical protein
VNSVLDHLLVGMLLLASLCYAFWSLGPRLLRARLLEALAVAFARVPGLGPLGRRFSTAAAQKQGGCGGCDGCAPAPPAGSSTEVRIPVAKIGRRT